MIYDPKNWYWLGEPGVYGSARGGLVITPETDADYLTWQGGGTQFPTAWPKDETEAITTAALDEVLVAAGLPPTGLTAPTKAGLLAYTMAKAAALLAASRPYTVAGVAGTIACDCGPSAADVGQALQWGSGTPTPTDILPWTDNDYATFNLTAAQAVEFGKAVGAYKISVFAVSTPAVASINSGTITTTAQIDALAWLA